MKSIRRIIIEDFQSHRHTDIELLDGFNVIVGPSDQGKTAVLRAIRWVLFNEPRGSDFIRVGATKAKVTLIMNDATMVIRERSSSRNRYTVAVPGFEEQIFEGFGNSVPEEVMLATGVRPMQMDEDHEVALHIGMQLDAPFLLDNNGAIKAKAIGRINGVHILDYAHKITSSELNSKQSEERKVQAEMEKIDEQLVQYSDLDDWEKQLQHIDELNLKLSRLEERNTWLCESREKLVETKKKLRMAENYLAGLSGLDEAATLWINTQEIESRLERIILLRNRLAETRNHLVQAQEFINRSKDLSVAEDGLSKADALFNKEEQARKLAGMRASIHVDLQKMDHIIGKTQGIVVAGDLYSKLVDVQTRQEQLEYFQLKRNEQLVLQNKVEAFLVKTVGLLKVEQIWEQCVSLTDRLEGVKVNSDRLHELLEQKQKLDAFVNKTQNLTIAQDKMIEMEKMDQIFSMLQRVREKWEVSKTEKAVVERELVDLDQHLHKLAEEYSNTLKNLGRCPICLGSIEAHTAERIIQEIK